MREAAHAVLLIAGWLSLAVGLCAGIATLLADAPVARDAYGVAIDTSALWAQRFAGAAWLLSGTVSWAVCIVLAAVSEESRETAEAIRKVMQ